MPIAHKPHAKWQPWVTSAGPTRSVSRLVIDVGSATPATLTLSQLNTGAWELRLSHDDNGIFGEAWHMSEDISPIVARVRAEVAARAFLLRRIQESTALLQALENVHGT